MVRVSVERARFLRSSGSIGFPDWKFEFEDVDELSCKGSLEFGTCLQFLMQNTNEY